MENNKIEVFGYKGKYTSNFYFIHNLNVFSFMIISDLGKYYVSSFNFSSITYNELAEEFAEREEDNSKPIFFIDKFELPYDEISFLKLFDRFSGIEITDQELEEFLEKYPEYNDFYLKNGSFYSNDELIELDLNDLKFSDNFGMFKLFIPVMQAYNLV